MVAATFVVATAFPVDVMLVVVFVAGDETDFFAGDAVVVFLTVDTVLLLLSFETVDVLLVTEVVLVAEDVAVLVAVAVLDATVPTVLTLLETVLVGPGLILFATVAEVFLLTLDVIVRGLAAGTVVVVRDAAELDFATADADDLLVVVVNGFTDVNFVVVPCNLALGALLILPVVATFLVAADGLRVVPANGFLAVVAALTSPLTTAVDGFLAIGSAFFSAIALLLATVLTELGRVFDGAVDGFAAPTDLLVTAEEAWLTPEALLTVLAVFGSFEVVVVLAAAVFGDSFDDEGVFLTVADADGFKDLAAVALVVLSGLVVAADTLLAVAFSATSSVVTSSTNFTSEVAAA